MAPPTALAGASTARSAVCTDFASTPTPGFDYFFQGAPFCYSDLQPRGLRLGILSFLKHAVDFLTNQDSVYKASQLVDAWQALEQPAPTEPERQSWQNVMQVLGPALLKNLHGRLGEKDVISERAQELRRALPPVPQEPLKPADSGGRKDSDVAVTKSPSQPWVLSLSGDASGAAAWLTQWFINTTSLYPIQEASGSVGLQIPLVRGHQGSARFSLGTLRLKGVPGTGAGTETDEDKEGKGAFGALHLGLVNAYAGDFQTAELGLSRSWITSQKSGSVSEIPIEAPWRFETTAASKTVIASFWSDRVRIGLGHLLNSDRASFLLGGDSALREPTLNIDPSQTNPEQTKASYDAVTSNILFKQGDAPLLSAHFFFGLDGKLPTSMTETGSFRRGEGLFKVADFATRQLAGVYQVIDVPRLAVMMDGLRLWPRMLGDWESGKNTFNQLAMLMNITSLRVGSGLADRVERRKEIFRRGGLPEVLSVIAMDAARMGYDIYNMSTALPDPPQDAKTPEELLHSSITDVGNFGGIDLGLMLGEYGLVGLDALGLLGDPVKSPLHYKISSWASLLLGTGLAFFSAPLSGAGGCSDEDFTIAACSFPGDATHGFKEKHAHSYEELLGFKDIRRQFVLSALGHALLKRGVTKLFFTDSVPPAAAPPAGTPGPQKAKIQPFASASLSPGKGAIPVNISISGGVSF